MGLLFLGFIFKLLKLRMEIILRILVGIVLLLILLLLWFLLVLLLLVWHSVGGLEVVGDVFEVLGLGYYRDVGVLVL